MLAQSILIQPTSQIQTKASPQIAGEQPTLNYSRCVENKGSKSLTNIKEPQPDTNLNYLFRSRRLRSMNLARINLLQEFLEKTFFFVFKTRIAESFVCACHD